jgi:lysophospholipase L1-like esterase
VNAAHLNIADRNVTSHAAVWGGLLSEILDPTGVPPYTRQRSIFKRLAKREHPGFIDGGANPTQPALVTWMERFQPHVVSILIGTNDLGFGVSPSALLDSVAAAVSSVLLPFSKHHDVESDGAVVVPSIVGHHVQAAYPWVGGLHEDASRRLECRRNAVVSTLLDRYGKHAQDVGAFNALLLRAATPPSRANAQRGSEVSVLSHPCVIVADGARGFVHEEHTCDGIHPNRAGERIVAGNLAPAIADALRRVAAVPSDSSGGVVWVRKRSLRSRR